MRRKREIETVRSVGSTSGGFVPSRAGLVGLTRMRKLARKSESRKTQKRSPQVARGKGRCVGNGKSKPSWWNRKKRPKAFRLRKQARGMTKRKRKNKTRRNALPKPNALSATADTRASTQNARCEKPRGRDTLVDRKDEHYLTLYLNRHSRRGHRHRNFPGPESFVAQLGEFLPGGPVGSD